MTYAVDVCHYAVSTASCYFFRTALERGSGGSKAPIYLSHDRVNSLVINHLCSPL